MRVAVLAVPLLDGQSAWESRGDDLVDEGAELPVGDRRAAVRAGGAEEQAGLDVRAAVRELRRPGGGGVRGGRGGRGAEQGGGHRQDGETQQRRRLRGQGLSSRGDFGWVTTRGRRGDAARDAVRRAGAAVRVTRDDGRWGSPHRPSCSPRRAEPARVPNHRPRSATSPP